MVSSGQIGEQHAKTGGILTPQIGWHLHPGQDDLYLGIFVPGAVDDRLQIAFGIGQRQAPQPVICTQCQDEDGNRALQDPIDATQPASGGFATEASVDDLKIPATCDNLFLDQGRKRLRRIESIASRQAVAEEQNGFRLRLRRLLGMASGSCQGHATQVHQAREQHQARDTGHMQTTPLLDVQHVSKTYHTEAGPLTILKDISFSLAAGTTCAVVGPSGSGKTTLLGLCAGLDRPSSGTVTLHGQSLHRLSEDALASLRNMYVGFVFQTFQLIPTLTALENVMVPVELRGDRRARPLAVELLQRVGLGERLRHYPVQLSGGEQQRVALARAFISQPRILYADEPTGNLDAETSAMVIDLLFTLHREAGTTLMLVTHDLDVAQQTQRLIRLKGGMIVEDSGPEPLRSAGEQGHGRLGERPASR